MTNNIIYGLITEAFGHGFMALNFTKAENLIPVAFSDKDNKEDFESHVEQIYNNMVFFCPKLRKATWEEREMYIGAGRNFRKDLLQGKISKEMWKKFARTTLEPAEAKQDDLPRFSCLRDDAMMFVPQKLQSDGMCGISAEQQSLPLWVFGFLKSSFYDLVLGQHFHKINDRVTVEKLAEEFKCYVPGEIEDEEVFGIRGVQHKMLWHLFEKLHGIVGIAGTHSWYALTCFPDISQLIVFNKRGLENWKDIEEAYQEAGKDIVCLGYDENTDMFEFYEDMDDAFYDLR